MKCPVFTHNALRDIGSAWTAGIIFDNARPSESDLHLSLPVQAIEMADPCDKRVKMQPPKISAFFSDDPRNGLFCCALQFIQELDHVRKCEVALRLAGLAETVFSG